MAICLFMVALKEKIPDGVSFNLSVWLNFSCFRAEQVCVYRLVSVDNAYVIIGSFFINKS